MSVDERIRSAFSAADESWEAGADEALRAVGRRRGRQVLVRRAAIAGALAAAVTVGAVLVGPDLLADRSAPDPIGPPSPPSQVETSPAGVTPSVLEGRWRTVALDEDDVAAVLEQTGNEQYADQVLPSLQPVPFRLVWMVTFETAELRLVAGDDSTILDQTTVEVGTDQVTIAPRFAEGSSVHGFAVDGDELRLTFVATTEAPVDGVPGQVWQRLLYDGFGFTRS